MKINKEIINVKDGLTDPIIKDCLDKIASGSIVMSAPCSFPIEWTDDERSKLKEALSKYYPAK